MKIYNLTRHATKPDQAECGVVDLPEHIANKIHQLSIFHPVPTNSLLISRANAICEILVEYAKNNSPVNAVMCGGAPYFNSILDNALKSYGFSPCYPYTQRTVDYVIKDGKRQTQFTYKHLGVVFV